MAQAPHDTTKGGNRLPLDEQRDHLLVQVAKMYFQLDRTQSDIASALGLTRWQVGRLLSEARDTGVVRIEIAPRANRLAVMEAELQCKWGLRDAIIVPNDADDSSTAAAVAQAAANWLSSLADKPTLLGLSWGQAMARVTRALPANWNPGVQVVLVSGANATRLTADSITTVAEAFAQSAGGSATLLPTPAILGRAETCAALESDPVIAESLDLARQAPLVIFGPVGMIHNPLTESGLLTNAEVDRLKEAGAVGDILGRFLDADGRVVDPDLDARTIGMRPEALATRDYSVAVSSGKDRHAIVLAALRAGLVNVLVTDAATAHHLLSINQARPDGASDV